MENEEYTGIYRLCSFELGVYTYLRIVLEAVRCLMHYLGLQRLGSRV